MIYICIPAYNEEQTVGVVLWKVRQVMTEFRRDYQIIVADDASTDSTQAVLAPYARVLPLTILRNAQRRGYAAALEMLLREAVARAPYPKRDVIVTLQGDFTDDPQDLVSLVKQVEAGADLVTGNAHLPEGTTRRRRWARRAAEWAARRAAWPEGAGDPLSSYRAYRVATLKRALDAQGEQRLLSCDGWAANAQLLHATAPHARRLEFAELTQRHERLQRETRFDGWQTFRQVFALARGRAPACAPAASIAVPADTRTARRAIHLDTNGSSTAVEPRQRRQPAAAGAARGRNERQRRNGTAGERPARSAGRAAPQRDRKHERPADAAPAAADARAADAAAAPGTEPSADGAQASTGERKRRARRGGRRRKSADSAGIDRAVASSADALEPTGKAEASGPPPPTPGSAEAQAAGEDRMSTGEGTTKRRRRSRRGSRGGRRRRAGAGEADAGSSDAPTTGAASADEPAGRPADAPAGGPQDGSAAYHGDDEQAPRRHVS